MGADAGALPELEAVHWRPRLDARRLRRRELLWTATTLAHVVPLVGTAVALVALEAWLLPVSLVFLAHAWAIPALYAQRGANVLRPATVRDAAAERRSAGLLADLVSHEVRELHARTGLAVERGELGTWVVGPAGAVVLRPGTRRADCWCVRVADPSIPAGDRIAHLLLALRADEHGFATVANLAFSGARRRVRRRLAAAARPALDAAAARGR